MVRTGRTRARILVVASVIALCASITQGRGVVLARSSSSTALREQPPQHRNAHRPKLFSDCDAGYVCLFTNANFGGQMEHYQNCCSWIPLADKGINNQVSSWRNRLNVDVLLAMNADGSGDHLCLNNNDSDAQLNATWDDAASAVRIKESDTIC